LPAAARFPTLVPTLATTLGSLRWPKIILDEGMAAMARCETCGNDYDKAFQVTMEGKSHMFDSFECAIHALAPVCAACGIHIVGHGLEKDGVFFCCDHCAEAKGVTELRDRA
jgi:hypothetical protein